MLAAPRAAHAVAAALVQVTNTAANPAVRQSVPKPFQTAPRFTATRFRPIKAWSSRPPMLRPSAARRWCKQVSSLAQVRVKSNSGTRPE